MFRESKAFRIFKVSGKTGARTQAGGVIKGSSPEKAASKTERARQTYKASNARTSPGNSDWYSVEAVRRGQL